MTPLITIQILGMIFQLKSKKAKGRAPLPAGATAWDLLDEDAIIEL